MKEGIELRVGVIHAGVGREVARGKEVIGGREPEVAHVVRGEEVGRGTEMIREKEVGRGTEVERGKEVE